ncbi:MAG: sulfatase-like hydrolase/transferase [Acidiferrobacterales bacterium]|nr:sulfatase-like hydrolase/transferase [Acidiferrobacterales bacterium]
MSLAYLIVYKGATKSNTDLEPFGDIDLVTLAKGAPIEQRNYAYADSTQVGKFYFREREGKALSLRLRLHRASQLLVKADIEYHGINNCGNEDSTRAVLSIYSPHVQSNLVMIANQSKTIEFDGYANSMLNVSLFNSALPGCGLASVQFFEKTRVRDFPTSFVLVWLAFFFAALRFKLSLSIPIFGSALNAFLITVSKFSGIKNATELFATTSFALMVCGVMLIIFSLIPNRLARTALISVLILLTLAIPAIFAGHYLAFDAPPTIDTFHAILQSHLNQVIEFWTDELGWKYIFASVLFLITLISLIFYFSSRVVNRSAGLLLGLLLIAINLRDLTTYANMHPMVEMPLSAYASYFQELSAFQKLQSDRLGSDKEIVANTNLENTTLVVVIGESANKWHMSSYGYPRATTPVVDKYIASGDMLRFDSAYSNHIYSNPTISKALTEADNYNGIKWSRAPSVMNLANAAGIHTSWVSNKLKLGPWDSVMSVIGDDANDTIHINKKIGQNLNADHYDEDLVPLVKRALNKKKLNRLIFVHLQGSHVSYASRYPDTHNKYVKAPSPLIFGQAIFHHRYNSFDLNHYDNSIFYTDFVLEKVLERLELESHPTAMLYFADHGESVFRRHSHNAAKFEYEMSEIPMFLWANQAWQNTYQQKWETLKSNKDKVFTNDHIFDTTLGLWSIESDHTHIKNDLSSHLYEAPQEPSTLHSKKKLAVADNLSYWLLPNLRWLRSQYPYITLSTEANTLAQVKRALFAGIDKVYLPTVFIDRQLFIYGNERYRFELDDFFKSFSEAERRKLVLKIDQSEDLDAIKTELNSRYPNINITANFDASIADLSSERSYQDMDLNKSISPSKVEGKSELVLEFKSEFKMQ